MVVIVSGRPPSCPEVYSSPSVRAQRRGCIACECSRPRSWQSPVILFARPDCSYGGASDDPQHSRSPVVLLADARSTRLLIGVHRVSVVLPALAPCVAVRVLTSSYIVAEVGDATSVRRVA